MDGLSVDLSHSIIGGKNEYICIKVAFIILGNKPVNKKTEDLGVGMDISYSGTTNKK